MLNRIVTQRGAFFLPAFWFSLAISAPAMGRAADTVMGKDRQSYFFNTYGIESGLPGGSVTVTLQTRDCYLWVGGGAGLARFDGV
ncbi:MAG: hypothetical protein KGJ13_12820, partial [Patescibacteria group bacterium]|nr:hypothetical protein [Patescibacteria group bacterium]